MRNAVVFPSTPWKRGAPTSIANQVDIYGTLVVWGFLPKRKEWHVLSRWIRAKQLNIQVVLFLLREDVGKGHPAESLAGTLQTRSFIPGYFLSLQACWSRRCWQDKETTWGHCAREENVRSFYAVPSALEGHGWISSRGSPGRIGGWGWMMVLHRHL